MPTQRRWIRTILVTLVTLSCLSGGLILRGRWEKTHRRPRLSPAVLARADQSFTAAEAAGAPLWISWTGVAGVRFEAAHTDGSLSTVLVDPYVTRHSIPELALPVDVDESTAERVFPQAEAIFVGHSHHDHVGDVASIARRTGAVVYGSASTCVWVKARGWDRCEEFHDGQRIDIGPVTVEVWRSEHGEGWFGVPFPGENHEGGSTDFVWDMKMGGAFAFVVRAHGRTVFHQGSAGLTDAVRARLAGLRPDVSMLGLPLREGTPDYDQQELDRAAPHAVFPLHMDDFFGGVLGDDFQRIPQVREEEFRTAVERRGIEWITPVPLLRIPVGPPTTLPETASP